MTALPAGTTTGHAIQNAARRVAASGSPSGRLDAELLLGKVTGWSRTAVLAHPERRLTAQALAAFEALVARREAAEPIAYLLGEREFYGRMFSVDRRALIPRPETELLVELGKAAIARWRKTGVEPRVVDVGTGAGGVAISLALESGARVLATDVSADALALAQENAARHGVHPPADGPAGSGEVEFVHADLLGGVSGPLHIVLANLPYVPSERALPADVRDYEPHVAIFGGRRGTELLERFLAEARPLLVPGAELCAELDEDEQATPMAAVTRQLYPGAEVSICQDAGGYDRVVRIYLPS